MSVFARLTLIACALCLSLSAGTGAILAWKPVAPADLAAKASKLEKDADAEGLFWEVHVMDEAVNQQYPQTVLTHYLRIKIYTERGRDAQSSVEIPYTNKIVISDIAGRTIRPDGAIVELKRDAIFDRTVAKANRLNFKARTFSMPAAEPGAIIEYRWRETRIDYLSNYMRLQFQREIPLREVSYFIKPLNHPALPPNMNTLGFHMPKVDMAPPDRDGYTRLSAQNIPAYKDEPYMPPEDEVRAWMLIYYAEPSKQNPQKFWQEHGREVARDYKPRLKVNDEVRQAATKAIGDAKTPEEQLAQLVRYVRQHVKNLRAEDTKAEQRDAAKINKTPADTLKQGIGTGTDINLLFAALATAAGFEARIAKMGDRSDLFFNQEFTNPHFLIAMNIAVQIGERWAFYDAAASKLPPGMLRWQEEYGSALICDPKAPLFVQTPLSGPDRSMLKRRATLTLSEDGTAEGEVSLDFTGHRAASLRASLERQSPGEREERIRKEVTSQYGSAELFDIRIVNLDDVEQPLRYRYHLKVPGYAQRTGKRLFVQPSYFQRQANAIFAASSRTHPVYFPYPWTEDDAISIDVPSGYELDHAEAPGSFALGKAGSYTVELGTKGQQLVYKRRLIFGQDGAILFPRETYPDLKRAFDMIHEQDEHTITLKQSAPGKPAAAGGNDAR